MQPTLTIIVPYFKRRYFDLMLESLARQTDQNFDVYVGDDGSPEDPAAIINKYRGRLRLTYHRFAENLGHRSVAGHWSRCVRQTASEWIWLFSDDDIAAPDCVAAFRQTLSTAQKPCDVYRFNTQVINGESALIHHPPPHPEWESGASFAFAKISEQRNSCAIEYIFKRSAFDAAGGFVDFPLAWCADDASWMAFSRQTGIRTIAQGTVFWRQSGLNLSSPNPVNADKKLAAWRRYFLWVHEEFSDPGHRCKYRRQIIDWFPAWLQGSGEKPSFLNGLKFWFFFASHTRRPNLKLLCLFLGVPGWYSPQTRWSMRLRRWLP